MATAPRAGWAAITRRRCAEFTSQAPNLGRRWLTGQTKQEKEEARAALEAKIQGSFADDETAIDFTNKVVRTAAGELPLSPILDAGWMQGRERGKKARGGKPVGRFRRKLANNPYARALETPLRRCVNVDVIVPRFFLADFEMVRHPETGAAWWAPGPLSVELVAGPRRGEEEEEGEEGELGGLRRERGDERGRAAGWTRHEGGEGARGRDADTTGEESKENSYGARGWATDSTSNESHKGPREWNADTTGKEGYESKESNDSARNCATGSTSHEGEEGAREWDDAGSTWTKSTEKQPTRQRPYRAPITSYVLCRQSLLEMFDNPKNKRLSVLLSASRTGMAIPPEAANCVWRQDMGGALLAMWRRAAVDALISRSCRGFDVNKFVEPCSSWAQVATVHLRGCVLWLPTQAAKSHAYATFDVPDALYGCKMAVHDLWWLLGQGEVARLRQESPMFAKSEVLVLKQWNSMSVQRLHMLLWRIHGYLVRPWEMQNGGA